jgi:hypothetical protein
MMVGRVMARVASVGEARRRRVAGDDEEKRQRSAGMRKGMELTGGPHMPGCEREKASLPECARSNRIRLSENTPMWLGPSGLSGEPAACGAGLGRMGRNPKEIPC